MNARRNFLRLAPLAAVTVVAPVSVAVATVALGKPSVPMRGTTPERAVEWADGSFTQATGSWCIMEVQTSGDIPHTKFVSHAMQQQADGKWVMVFDREA